MFEGSEHHDSGFFQPLQAAGASLNGSTSADRTNYWEVVPPGRARAGAVDGVRSHGLPAPGADPAEVLESARRGAERAPAELREPAVRPGVDGDAGGAVPAGPSLPLDDHRRSGRSPGREAGRSPAVLPALLSSGERVDFAGGRHRPRGRAGARARVLRADRSRRAGRAGACDGVDRRASDAFCWKIAWNCRASTSRG